MAKITTLARQSAGLDTSKVAIIYPRQSSGDQVKNNVYSLDRQMQLRETAVRDGFVLDRVMVVDDDLGVSGRRIDLRAGFTRALALMDQGVVSAIYVEDLTRLSRDERTIDQMIIADACERAGVLIYMGGSWYDMRDSGQRQSYKYQAVGLSESWKAHLDKLAGGQREKAMQGRAATHPVRFGYRANKDVPKRHPDRDKLTVYEPEADIIRAIVARFFEMGTLRATFRAVDPVFWPDGSRLSFATVRRTLTDVVYRGTYHWGDVYVPEAHEAIISPEDGARIDEMLSLNKATRRSGSENDRPVLAGLTWCPTCRRRIYTGSSAGKATYRCQAITAGNVDRGPAHFTVRAAPIEALVMADLWARLDRGLIADIVKRLEGDQRSRANVADLGEASRRALKAKVDGLTKSLVVPDLGDHARRILLAELEAAAGELDAMQNTRPASMKAAVDLAVYADLLRDPAAIAMLPATWDDEPTEWRRAWVRRFIDRIEVQEHDGAWYEVRVSYRDGSVAKLTHRHRTRYQPEELAAVRDLWNDPARPAEGWNAWMGARLRERGFTVDRRRLYRLVDSARGISR